MPSRLNTKKLSEYNVKLLAIKKIPAKSSEYTKNFMKRIYFFVEIYIYIDESEVDPKN